MAALRQARIPAVLLRKVTDGSPHCVDAIREGKIALVVNTTLGAKEIRDSYSLRRHALLGNVPYFTTMAAAMAVADALEAEALLDGKPSAVQSLQEWHHRGAQPLDSQRLPA